MAISFTSLALSEPIQRALRERNYTTPSPIQEQTIPLVLERNDVMGCAQTGTGKTAAFALPILEHLSQNPRKRTPRCPRVLVIAPTRELAIQINESFLAYGTHLSFRSEVIFGGVGQNPQVQALRKGPEVLVATPGRLLDLVDQGHLSLDRLEVFVIDEADRMLDMGFIHDVRKVIRLLPERRQSLFFSATMPDSIIDLAGTILKNPKHVEVTPPATTVEKIDQQVCHVASTDKRSLLIDILKSRSDGLTLVFAGMKHAANRIAEALEKNGIPAAAIHGNKSQSARVRALESFRSGKIRVLVATDIAARGIDVKGINLVINYDLPNEPDSYVHRIGRTARAGSSGHSISFCDEKSQGLLRQIEKNIRMSIPVNRDHSWHRDPQAGDRDESLQQQARRGRTGRGQRNRTTQSGSGDNQNRQRNSGSKRPATNRRRRGGRGRRPRAASQSS